MYTGVLDQNWIINLFRSIGYPIGPPSKIYEDNRATIKILLADRINLQARPLGVLITSLHELHVRKKLKWCTQEQTCNLLTSIPNLMVEKVSEISLIVPLVYDYILSQDHFIINNFFLASFMIQITLIVSNNNKSEIKTIKISSAHIITKKALVYQI